MNLPYFIILQTVNYTFPTFQQNDMLNCRRKKKILIRRDFEPTLPLNHNNNNFTWDLEGF